MALSSRRPRRRRFLLFLLILASITVLTLDFRDAAPVRGLRDVVSTVFSPVRGAADTVFGPVGDGWHAMFHYGDVKAENRQLRKQIDELKGQRIQNTIDQKRYQELLNEAHITSVQDLPTVIAEVTQGPLNNYDDTIQINQGAGEGIKPGMPVVTSSGLVGKVVQVQGGQSTVLLITSPQFYVDIALTPPPTDPSPGARGIAHGQGAGRPLLVDSGIVAGTPVPKGQVVQTSGVGTSSFPAAVPVGRVASSKQSSDGIEIDVEVAPSADLKNLAYVRVVLSQSG
jgi:rod shape-determining protein MreC